MLMILAQLGCSESFWAVAKVRSPHTGPGISYIIDSVRRVLVTVGRLVCSCARDMDTRFLLCT